MPTYDYACSACGHRFEKFHSMTAEPLRQCPECNQDTLERLIGPGAGIIFKGSGFYQTDYKGTRGGSSSDSDSSDKGSSGESSAPSCGTDSAPAGCDKKKD